MPPRKRAGSKKGGGASSKRAKPRSTSPPPGDTRSKFSKRQSDAWFDTYKATDSDAIDPAGTMRFCEDINVTPEDVITLVISWKCQCEAMGRFTRSEWTQGMSAFGCDNAAKLRERLPALRQQLRDDANMFQEVYKYAFHFAKSASNPGQRSIDKQMAVDMWAVLLGDRWSRLKEFSSFVLEHDIKVINLDQWNSLLELIRSLGDDLSRYDDNSAWPVLFDEYVEHVREREGAM